MCAQPVSPTETISLGGSCGAASPSLFIAVAMNAIMIVTTIYKVKIGEGRGILFNRSVPRDLAKGDIS
jgi:hypothetical protein